MNYLVIFFSLLHAYSGNKLPFPRHISVNSRYIGELLCRKCGAHITNQNELVNVTRIDSKTKYRQALLSTDIYSYSYEFPLVGKNTTINVFENPAGETFHMIGCKKAHLKYYGPVRTKSKKRMFSVQASLEATWFPGFQWTICVCPQCGQHLGWCVNFQFPQRIF